MIFYVLLLSQKGVKPLINTRIQELRKSLNLTQKEFGQRLNLSQNQISSLEKGIRNIRERVICDICKEFNVNRKWLVDGEEPIFTDFLQDLDIDAEVKELGQLYAQLDKDEQKIVKGMITSLLKAKS